VQRWSKPVAISVSGKGGTGKTTFTALLLKALLEEKDKTILVIDADPAANLPDVLGVEVEMTVGDIVEELKDRTERGEAISLPPQLFEMYVQEAIVETDRFDLIVMGRTESKGCYCYVNSVLRQIMQMLAKNYDIVLIDCEAGLEHIQRRVDQDIDILIVMTDSSKMGMHTARKIVDLARKMGYKMKVTGLVGNFSANSDVLSSLAREINAELLGVLPYDENIVKFNREGQPLLKLPEDSPAYTVVRDIARKLGLIS